ncbi:MAG: glycosyltransferase family 39 protein, partial [Dehalococcoidia bacterium]|nr:glycosyltransferase family 39 protein [Dehalococcoidia bacterium]
MTTSLLGRALAGAGPGGRALTPPRLARARRSGWLSLTVVALGLLLFGAAALALIWPMLGKPYVYDEVSFAQVAEGVVRTGLPYANVGFMINEKGELDKQFQYGLWHPPMYVFTLGWWMSVFGISATSARLFGVFTMMLTALFVALTARTALRDHPNRDGFALWGAALYIFNPLTLQSALLLDIDGTVLTVMLMALVWLYLVVQNWGWSGRLLLGVVFALALWAKMTTPFFVLPALVVYRLLQGKVERGVVEAGAIGVIGVGLFLPSWWIVCRLTGMPFTMPFEVLYREFLDAAGHG